MYIYIESYLKLTSDTSVICFEDGVYVDLDVSCSLNAIE